MNKEAKVEVKKSITEGLKVNKRVKKEIQKLSQTERLQRSRISLIDKLKKLED
jgi:hypothetical protein